MPESVSAVWTAISSFFDTGFTAALSVLTAIPILVAPLIMFIASRALGMGKSLLKLGGGRKGK